MFLSTVKKVKLEVRPLFLPQLVRLTTMLKPGLRSINVRTKIYYEKNKNFICLFCFILFYIYSGQIQDGLNFTKMEKKQLKHLMFLLHVFMIFILIEFCLFWHQCKKSHCRYCQVMKKYGL